MMYPLFLVAGNGLWENELVPGDYEFQVPPKPYYFECVFDDAVPEEARALLHSRLRNFESAFEDAA